MFYRTASNHWYHFINGRVSNVDHKIEDEPVWSFSRDLGGRLRFRTPRGWYLTTAVLESVPA